MIPETCKNCKYRKQCSGHTSKGSPNCKRHLSHIKKEKSYGWFLRLFNGDKEKALSKYIGDKYSKK